MKKENEAQLSINATLADLELEDISIEVRSKVSEALKILRERPLVPGLVIESNKVYRGVISRNKIFECMSRPFSNELYTNKSIEFLLEDYQFGEALEFLSETSIPEATLKSLKRPVENLFDPIVVRFYNDKAKLLDIHKLLLAQSRIHLLVVDTLKEANEFKSEILGIAAHDLKNPLNSILGICSIIREETKELPLINQMVETIYKSSQHMLQLIIQLLNSTVVEMGKIELNKIPIDINNLIISIIQNNIKIAEKKQQKIIFNSEVNSGVFVFGDKVHITDAIENIISNAIKYSPKGKTIDICLQVNNSKIRICVIDEGPGIRKEEKEKLFGKFQRLSAKPTGGESSTGLGLYIVKQIIELHEGSIWVESEYGNGSMFIIELPIKLQKNAA